MSKSVRAGISLLVLAGLVLAACATPTPQTVEVTRIVEGEPQTVVVTATPGAEEQTTSDTSQIIAADGLVDCQPLPEGVPSSASAGGALASPSVASQPAASSAAARPASSASSPAAQGDTIYRVGVFEDVTSTNYWVANGPDNTVWNSYMLPPRVTLYALSDVNFSFYPVLATEMPGAFVQDGDFWVADVPIRDDVTWSDGEPMTAADIAFTANTTLRFGLISGNWQQWYDGNFIDHVEPADDYTVRFVFHTKPGLARFQYGMLQGPIMAEHFWAPLADQAAAPITTLGESPDAEALVAAQAEAQDNLFAIDATGEPLAGAFTLSTREPGAFLENGVNPDYLETGAQVTLFNDGTYQETDPDGRSIQLYGEGTGEPELQLEVGPFVGSAIYSVYGSQDAAILALQAGEIDFVLNSLGLQRGLLNTVEGDPNLTVTENPTLGFRYMSFNNRRQPMNDCAFRQAISALIDKEFVTNTILQRVAAPVYTYVPEGNAAWYFDDVPKLGQGLDRTQRLDLAIAILEQAGYSWEGGVKPTVADDGTVNPSGRLLMPDGTAVPDLQLWAPNAGYDPLRSTFAIWIESWLKEAGIPVTANLAGFNALIPRIFTEQDFDMYILGWTLGNFPSYLRDFLHSEQAVPDGNNAGGYTNPTFDALADGLLTCETQESCKQIADEIQTTLSTETPYVLLFETPIVEAYRSASIAFPYEKTLNGLQGAQGNVGGVRGIETFVKVQ